MFPLKMVIFNSFLLNYQRVYLKSFQYGSLIPLIPGPRALHVYFLSKKPAISIEILQGGATILRSISVDPAKSCTKRIVDMLIPIDTL